MVKNSILPNKTSLGSFAVPLCFALLFYCLSQINFLFFHVSVELFCVVTAFILLVIVVNTQNISEDTCFTFLGIAFGFIGVFTALHALSYTNIGIFPGNTANITVQLRVVSAYIQAFSLLFFVSFFDKKINIRVSFYTFFAVCIIFLILIFRFNLLPVFFIENVGHTPVKIANEIIICFIYIASTVVLIKRKERLKNIIYQYLLFSLLSMICSELMFSLYIDWDSPLNIAGHIFKYISFYYIYKSVIETSLNYPYRLLREVNEELSLQKAYFQQLFEGSPEGIVMLDSEDKVININKGFEDLFQFSLEEAKGRYINDLIVPHSMHEEASNYSKDVLNGNVIHAETIRKRKDGSDVYVHILGYPIASSNKQIGVYGIYSDITERKKAEEKILYLSFHDKLTGLYNRAFFEEELKRLDTERQLPISIIMGDLNNLKIANDIFGHDSGDQLLIKVSEILKKHCRSEDIIARWGGDEFVMLLPQTDEDTALVICDRIKTACNESMGNPIQPSIALGVATKTQKSKDIKNVIEEAEHNMYKNKLNEHKNIGDPAIVSLEKLLLEKNFSNKELTIGIQEIVRYLMAKAK